MEWCLEIIKIWLYIYLSEFSIIYNTKFKELKFTELWLNSKGNPQIYNDFSEMRNTYRANLGTNISEFQLFTK